MTRNKEYNGRPVVRAAIHPVPLICPELYLDIRAPKPVNTAFYFRYLQEVQAYDAHHEKLRNLEAFREQPTKKEIKPGVYSLEQFCEQY